MLQIDKILFWQRKGDLEAQNAGPDGKAFRKLGDQEFRQSHRPGLRPYPVSHNPLHI